MSEELQHLLLVNRLSLKPGYQPELHDPRSERIGEIVLEFLGHEELVEFLDGKDKRRVAFHLREFKSTIDHFLRERLEEVKSELHSEARAKLDNLKEYVGDFVAKSN